MNGDAATQLSESISARQPYRVRLAQGWKVVLAMVLPPLPILPSIFLLAQFKGLSESVVFTVISVMVLLVVALAIWLVEKSIAHVDYAIEGNRHRIEVLRPTFLSVRSFDFDFADVLGFGAGRVKERFYFTLRIRGYPAKFSINAASDAEDDVARFNELLCAVAEKAEGRRQ